MKSFFAVAGTLAVVGVVAAGVLYLKRPHDASATGGKSPGATGPDARPLTSCAKVPNPPPPGGFKPPAQNTTASDVAAWAYVAGQGVGMLRDLYDSAAPEDSAVSADPQTAT